MPAADQCSHEAYWRSEIARRDDEITRLRAELRSRPPFRGRDPDIDVDLTEREQEVLDLIVRGCTSQEIADVLYLGVNSVKTHTRSLFKKLGVTTRTQAAMWSVGRDADAGLVD